MRRTGLGQMRTRGIESAAFWAPACGVIERGGIIGARAITMQNRRKLGWGLGRISGLARGRFGRSGAPHASLAARIRGEVIAPGHPGYDAARQIWNNRFDRRPAAVVRVADADDVAAALDHAARNDLSVAIRSGGHSMAGWSSSDGGLVIDLRRLNTIEAYSDGVVSVGAGVWWGRGGSRAAWTRVADVARLLQRGARCLGVGSLAPHHRVGAPVDH